MKISSDVIKSAMAAYWRYNKQCPVVAFEASFNGGQSDVLAVTAGRRLIEVEVKISLSDVRKDKKKPKHSLYRGESPMRHYFLIPSLFYFAVPYEVANKVALICDHLYPYAGVFGVTGPYDYSVSSHRRARGLPSRKLTLLDISRITKSQSGTVCRLARDLAIIKAGRNYAGRLDLEDKAQGEAEGPPAGRLSQAEGGSTL